MAHDITEIKKSEEELEGYRNELEKIVSERSLALKKSEARLSHLIKDNPAILYTCEYTDDISVTFISENVSNILGYNPSDFLDDRDFRFSHIHPDDAQSLLSVIRKLPANISRTCEYRFRKNNDDYIWIADEFKILNDSSGKPSEIIGYMADITEKKLFEEKLIRATLNAERANHSKSEFLSRMSHELRTPLNAILGFSQLLDMKLSDGENKLYIGEITKAGKLLLHLINDILDLTKIEAGKIDLATEKVNLYGIIEDTLTIISPLMNNYKIQIENKINPLPAHCIYADPTRFKQILINLISNGIKYNKPSGKVSILAENTADNYIRICIQDTGTGLSKEQQQKLFNPFERAGAENSKIEGTGIGLVVTKELVELMGGRIGLESEIGRGSIFWIEMKPAENL